MSEIVIIVALVFIILILLAFIYYLFVWRKNLIKNTPLEIENFFVLFNKKINDQFKDINKQIKYLKNSHETHQKDILNKMSSGTLGIEHNIKTEFKNLNAVLNKFLKDIHHKITNIISSLEVLTQ